MRITDNQEQAFNSFTPKWKRKKRKYPQKIKGSEATPLRKYSFKKVSITKIRF